MTGRDLYMRACDPGAADWEDLSPEGQAIWADAERLISRRLQQLVRGPEPEWPADDYERELAGSMSGLFDEMENAGWEWDWARMKAALLRYIAVIDGVLDDAAVEEEHDQ